MSDIDAVSAEPVDDDRPCSYECENNADWLVEFVSRAGTREKHPVCRPCSRKNRVHVEANELVDDVHSDEGGQHG